MLAIVGLVFEVCNHAAIYMYNCRTGASCARLLDTFPRGRESMGIQTRRMRPPCCYTFGVVLFAQDAIAYNWPSPDKTMAADDQSPSVDLDFKKVSRCPCISLMSHCGTIRLRLLVVFGDAMQSQALAMRAMCGRQALLLPL